MDNSAASRLIALFGRDFVAEEPSAEILSKQGFRVKEPLQTTFYANQSQIVYTVKYGG